MSNSLAVPEPNDRTPVAAASAMPSPAEWQMIQGMAEALAQSSLVPGSYRGKPANIVLAALAGRPFGWEPTMSMRSFHIIDGSPSMRPETQLALVRQAGHSVTGETGPTGARVTGTRRDTGDTMTVSFTLEDAKRAGLLGRKGPWQQFPQSMCWARALSQLCRMLFPDVLLGAAYTPEELGAEVNEDGEVIEASAVVVEPAGHPASWAKEQVLRAANGDVDLARQVWEEHIHHTHTLTNNELHAVIHAAEEAAGTTTVAAGDVLDAREESPSTQAQRQRIGILRRELGLDDDTYRATLRKDFGVESSTELAEHEATQVIARLERALVKRAEVSAADVVARAEGRPGRSELTEAIEAAGQEPEVEDFDDPLSDPTGPPPGADADPFAIDGEGE